MGQVNFIPWEQDYRSRMHPELLTSLLHEAVPVLKYINWSVSETAEGFARTILPLSYESTNQHGTHQAALITIAADYTGGIALATLVRGIPILGVHPQPSDNGAALWLVSMNISYKIPSASDLNIVSRIEPENFTRIAERYNSGKQLLERIDIAFESGGESVATGTFTYFLKQSKYLKPQTPEGRVNVLFSHRVKASARLIAGVRATENDVQNGPLYSDPYSPIAAGIHGRLLAQRHIKILPELRDMVAARTKNIDDFLLEAIGKGAKQLVFVGVGFDFRVFRLISDHSDIKIFELDLSHMLFEREKIISGFANSDSIQRKSIGINLELEDVADKLLATNIFDPLAATCFIVEGASMYFEENVNRRIFASIRRIMANSQSMVWIDIVTKSVIEGTSGYSSVENFVKGMEKLGEPFIFGLNDPVVFFAKLGFTVQKSMPSDSYNDDHSNPIFALYNFHILLAENEDATPKGSHLVEDSRPVIF